MTHRALRPPQRRGQTRQPSVTRRSLGFRLGRARFARLIRRVFHGYGRDELDLQVGTEVVALVKSTEVSIALS